MWARIVHTKMKKDVFLSKNVLAKYATVCVSLFNNDKIKLS